MRDISIMIPSCGIGSFARKVGREREGCMFLPVSSDDMVLTRRNAKARQAEQMSYEELTSEMDECRERILTVRKELPRYFVGRQELVDLMIISTAAQEPFLVVGPPGTAKSDVVVKFAQALGIEPPAYFEYMLTKFTEPSELMGPVDISQLKEGRYVRKHAGYLPEAKLAFLDEVFRGNSAILNTLLTAMNERNIYENGVAKQIPLVMMFAAANDIAESGEYKAFRDRFTLKYKTPSVWQDRKLVDDLIARGMSREADREFGRKPWANLAELDDFVKVKRWLTARMSGLQGGAEGSLAAIEADRKAMFGDELYELFKRILLTLESEARLYISDRKVVKLYRLIRTRAYLFHGGAVKKEDLSLLRYIADGESQIEVVRETVDQQLSISS